MSVYFYVTTRHRLFLFRNSVALLTWFTIPNNIRAMRSGNSIAIDLGHWLGKPGLPYIISFVYMTCLHVALSLNQT